MNDAREGDFNTVQFLLNKQYSPTRRKISEYIVQETERPNFVVRHQAEKYDVVRAYMNSSTPQVGLYYSKFTPRSKEATICIIHGYGESTDNYIQMAEFFVKNRFVVNMIDLRSFGYSGGRRVNEPLNKLLSDIESLLKQCCEKGLPTYIISHGFGSLLLLGLLQENPNLPISGVVSLSPLFSFPFFNKASFIGKCLLWLLAEFWPDLMISNMINPTALTNNNHKVKQCIDGVFNYQFVTFPMVQAFDEYSKKVMREAHKFQYPLFVCYGAKNTIQPKEDVKRFYQLAGSKDKASFVFKNGFHQLFQDLEAEEQVFPKILQWITEVNSRNTVRWGKIPDLNLRVVKRLPWWIKYAILTMISLTLLIVKKLRTKK